MLSAYRLTCESSVSECRNSASGRRSSNDTWSDTSAVIVT